MVVATTLLAVEDVANLFGVSARTVRRWARAGVIPVTRLTNGGALRFREIDIDRVLEERTHQGGTEVAS